MARDHADEQEQQREPEDAPPASTRERRMVTSDDFLVPGPTPDSNEGLARWGITWLVFSLLLILLMLGITVVCWLLATWTGIA
jgi:hypothetical protein